MQILTHVDFLETPYIQAQIGFDYIEITLGILRVDYES